MNHSSKSRALAMLFACLASVASISLAADRIDHLHPPEDLVSLDQEQFERLNSIRRELLFERPLDSQIAVSYMAISGELRGFTLAAKLTHPRSDGFGPAQIASYHLTAVNMKPARKVIIPVPAEIAVRLVGLWEKFAAGIAASTRYEEGLDGESYYFGTRSGSMHSVVGKTWSPAPGMRMHSLVQISDAIIANAFQKVPQWTALADSMTKLEKQLSN